MPPVAPRLSSTIIARRTKFLFSHRHFNDRQPYNELAAGAKAFAFRSHAAAVHLDEAAHKRQADA